MSGIRRTTNIAPVAFGQRHGAGTRAQIPEESRQIRETGEIKPPRVEAKSRGQESCQFDASGDVPFWNATLPHAPFMAQLLGQQHKDKNNTRWRGAYSRNDDLPVGAHFDERV